MSVLWLIAATCVSAFAQVASPSRPFSDRSLWNARPAKFALGTFEIPRTQYFPAVAEGAYSVRVFVAKPADPAVTVYGLPETQGIWIADAETHDSQIVIPHWPSDVVPATGGDGHADIVDPASNRIHSFWQLKFVDGKWRAAQYTWTALDGRGWGDPGHYFQGSRAAGVPPMAGLIRTTEIDDGQPTYRHALAMSLASSGLSANPTYVFPATAADSDAAKVNHGAIPEGTRMMLPAGFDMASIKDAKLAKVARTLQTYGAYVVDSNGTTPFVIYVEIGSGFSLMPPSGWDNEIAAQLDHIRSALRPVTSVTQWVDAKGEGFVPERRLNLLSMRGPWFVIGQGTPGVFDSWQQAVLFAADRRQTVQTNASGRSMATVDWATPHAGETMRLAVSAANGATLRLALVDASSQTVYDSGVLAAGRTVDFKWPAAAQKPVLTITSGPQGGGRVAATLVSVDRTS